MKQLIKDLKVFYDIIIFDTVSILEAPEAAILAKESDLVLMMSSYGNTKMDEFAKAYEKIKDIDEVMVGMGLNKIPDRKLKKKLANVKVRWKHWSNKVLGKMGVYCKKLKQLLKNCRKVGIVFAFIGSMIVAGGVQLKKVAVKVGQNIKLKSQDMKEHIKNYKAKREKIKLIESGSMIVEPDEKIPNVLEKEEMIAEEPIEELEVKPTIAYVEKQNKSKFDLIREQQEKKEPVQTKTREELQTEQRLEREKKEAEKKLQQEEMKNFKDIDFQSEETITEEMIRRQVEMDDMIRMAELERQEEKMNLKKQKLLRKNEKKKEREARKEMKAKMKEEKKASRERVKQIYIEEARIDAQLKEDNLYPRIRIQ